MPGRFSDTRSVMQTVGNDSKKEKPLRPWLGPLIIGGTFLLIFAAERRRPLRERRESSVVRTSRNFTMAALSAASVAILQPLLLIPLLRSVENRRLGLLHRLPLPGAARTVLGVLLLDYTLWWWHWMNHRIPFLWRFHLPHHVDLDLDASTAIRFHFGEMSLSVLYRMLQIRLLGVGELSMSLWQLLLFPSIFFHHSNLALTEEQDRLLSRFVVTPRMHGIHHIHDGDTVGPQCVRIHFHLVLLHKATYRGYFSHTLGRGEGVPDLKIL